MKRLVVLLIAGFAMLAVALPAQAEDYLGEVKDGLKTSPVYIAPGTEGTDANTAAELQGMLNSDDNIALVMLPNSAKSGIGSDLQSFVANLSKAVGPQYIIGFAVDDQTVGYSTTMPTGVAGDLMNRAASVSTSPVETLGTFVRNVHRWQAEHPEAKTTGTQTASSGIAQYWWVLVAALVLVALVLGGKTWWKSNRSGEARKRFDGPDKIKPLLSEIAHRRDYVKDEELRSTLYQCCMDIERYFQKYTTDEARDASTFQGHLKSVLSVLKKYLEIQDDQRYYNHPTEKMRQGKESIQDFAEYVIDSIRRGNDAELLDYKVDTQILGAQKYR